MTETFGGNTISKISFLTAQNLSIINNNQHLLYIYMHIIWMHYS
jgi:hypothetical protein